MQYDPITEQTVKRILENARIVRATTVAPRAIAKYRIMVEEYTKMCGKIDGWGKISFNETKDIVQSEYCKEFSDECETNVERVISKCDDYLAMVQFMQTQQTTAIEHNDNQSTIIVKNCSINGVVGHTDIASITKDETSRVDLETLVHAISELLTATTNLDATIKQALLGHLELAKTSAQDNNKGSLIEQLTQIATGAISSGLWQIVLRVSEFMAKTNGLV